MALPSLFWRALPLRLRIASWPSHEHREKGVGRAQKTDRTRAADDDGRLGRRDEGRERVTPTGHELAGRTRHGVPAGERNHAAQIGSRGRQADFLELGLGRKVSGILDPASAFLRGLIPVLSPGLVPLVCPSSYASAAVYRSSAFAAFMPAVALWVTTGPSLRRWGPRCADPASSMSSVCVVQRRWARASPTTLTMPRTALAALMTGRGVARPPAPSLGAGPPLSEDRLRHRASDSACSSSSARHRGPRAGAMAFCGRGTPAVDHASRRDVPQ